MNIVRLENAVCQQLALSNSNALESLKVQNHIYGCYIIMEDIAQNNTVLKDNLLSQDSYSFNLDTQFGEIGLRYGFYRDTKLMFDCMPEYKSAWMEQFQLISESHEIEYVDVIEDKLITIVQTDVKQGYEFFMNATETGILSQTWTGKVVDMLLTGETDIAFVADTTHNDNNDSNASKLSLAQSDTTRNKKTYSTKLSQNPFAFTRHIASSANCSNTPTKKHLSKTRRAKCKSE